MDAKERDEEMRKLIEGSDVDVEIKKPELRLVILAANLDCGWEECPRGFHRFMLHTDKKTGEPRALSICIEDSDGKIEQLGMNLSDALTIYDVLGELLSPLIELRDSFPPSDNVL